MATLTPAEERTVCSCDPNLQQCCAPDCPRAVIMVPRSGIAAFERALSTERHAREAAEVERETWKRLHRDSNDALSAANAKLAALVEVFAPFAAIYAEARRDFHDGSRRPELDLSKEAWGFNNATVKWADFHRAYEALSALEGQTDAQLREFGWAPGNYMIQCIDCLGDGWIAGQGSDKRAIRCKACAQKLMSAVPTQAPQDVAPIPMLLFCPKCGVQHVDEATDAWPNPSHRSHLCDACGCIWRPADVPTEGVEAITTKGRADTWVAARPHYAPSSQDVAGLVEGDEAAKAEVLRELYGWTGSAFLAGEKMSAAAQLQAKGDLYSFLCGLIGWLMPDEPVRASPISQETEVPDFLKRQTGELPPARFPTWGEDEGREGRRLGAEEDPDNNHKALVEALKNLAIVYAELPDSHVVPLSPAGYGAQVWTTMGALRQALASLTKAMGAP